MNKELAHWEKEALIEELNKCKKALEDTKQQAMTPIKLLRELFHLDNKLHDYQVVIFVYEEFGRVHAPLSPIPGK